MEKLLAPLLPPSALTLILSQLNIITIAKLSCLNRSFRNFVFENKEMFTYFNSLGVVPALPNIYVLKLLQRFPKI